ncbi:MAG: VCBS repeat-containing protein [Pyrinomonadaceae bacterium]
MSRIAFLFLTTALLVSSCNLIKREQAANVTPVRTPISVAASTPAPTSESTPEGAAGMSATVACQKIDPGEFDVYRKQTFAIDFEPFRNSCFVTSYNPEYKDPPLESQFAIFKNGKKAFDFPSQFNGVNFGCWIDAVSFKDLNGDEKTDVIVVTKCQGKEGTYNENSVYVNDGKGFTTREDANTQLSEFKSVKQLVDFVQENRSMFF